MSKSESEIQSEILLEVSKRGHRMWRTNAGRAKSRNGGVIKLMPAGYPDVTGFRKSDGKFVVIEVKKPSGRLSKNQKKFRDMIIEQPVIYGVARSAKEAIDIIENGAKYYK